MEPPRCKHCLAPLGYRFRDYYKSLRENLDSETALDTLDVDFCCKIVLKTFPKQLFNTIVQVSIDKHQDHGCSIYNTEKQEIRQQ